MSKPWRDESTLRELYIEQGLSMADTGDKLGVSGSTIKRWLNRHNIPTRTVAEGNSDGDVMKLRDKEWLRNQYIEREKSTYDIADELNVSDVIVSKWLRKNDIETRDSYQERAGEDIELLHDKEWLQNEYHENGKTLYDIAEICDCAPQTVRYWIHRHEMDTDSYSESFTDGDLERVQDEEWLRKQYHGKGLNQRQIAEIVGMSQAGVGKYMERLNIDTRSDAEILTEGDVEKLKDEAYLREEYWSKGKTTGEIANQIGVCQQTVSRNMDLLNIPIRENPHPTGEDHHNYSGDMPKNGNYYGPNWKTQRLKAIVRDNARCRRCGVSESTHYEKYGRALHVHHIRNKRKFTDNTGIIDWKTANELENLITLCAACHHEVERFPVDLDVR